MSKTLRKIVRDRTYECRRAGNGTFYIYWSEDRRSRRKSTGQKSLPAAQAFFDEWCALTEAETPGRVLTCEDLYRIKYPEGEVEIADYAWRRMADTFGHLTLAEVTEAVEQGYVKRRLAAGGARATIRVELSMLRASWNYAADRRRKIISADDLPALGPLPDDSPARERWLTEDEVKRLFAAAEDGSRRVRLFMWLALETGARRTAIQDLKWDQVDWEIRVIRYLPPGASQTKKRRATVPISDTLLPVLQEAHATREPGDPFVIGAGGKINTAVANLAKRAGVEDVTPHVFRRTAGTWMTRHGVPLFHVAKVLGNTVEVAEKHYAQHAPEHLREAVGRIMGGR